MAQVTEFSVNGEPRRTEAEGDTPLLYVLRNDFDLKAAKFGCGLGQCGTCTVLVDGRPVQSCDVPLWSIAGKNVETLEGLSKTPAGKALQDAFVTEQAAQCGYCIPGILVSAAALLQNTSKPNDEEIAAALSRNLCRCGTHVRILRGIRRAAAELAR
jgi:nicotinate dehydrogenase subunit A